MYVGFQIVAPDQNLGLDYAQEYELAKILLGKED
jgi:hypothetical protein